MKNLLFFITFFLLSKTTIAQSLEREVIASSGDFVVNAQGSISYTIGESVALSGNDGVNILTQGFQQPFTDVIIPVEFGAFVAYKQDDFVKLNWFTYSEQNSLRFDIERSGDVKSFSKIAETKASGTSNVRNDYNVLDKSPLEGINYYRLRQIDFNGHEKLSNIISIYFDKNNQLKNWARVYPTVVLDNAIIECQFTNDAHLIITNILGYPLSNLHIVKSENRYQKTFSMNDLPNGTYFFIFKTIDTQIIQKIIKQ